MGTGLTALFYPTWCSCCQKFLTAFCCIHSLSTPNFPSCNFSFSFSFIILCAHLGLSRRSSLSKYLFVRNPPKTHSRIGVTLGIHSQRVSCSVVEQFALPVCSSALFVYLRGREKTTCCIVVIQNRFECMSCSRAAAFMYRSTRADRSRRGMEPFSPPDGK